MRIGLFHDSAGTRHAGGIAVYTQQLAAKLAPTHEVYLYTQAGDLTDVLADTPVTVVSCPPFDDHIPTTLTRLSPINNQLHTKFAMMVWAVTNDITAHIETNCDVLITFQFFDDLCLSHLIDVPTVYMYHSLTGLGLGTKARERLSQTDIVLANSNETATRIRDVFDYDVTATIYPGVDLERFHPAAAPAFETDKPALLFVGRLVESKGVFDLLEAVSTLEREVAVHLVGRDDDGIAEHVHRLGLAETVTLHGEVPHLELPHYYAAADICCHPTYAETFGMANIEAMACGLPVVTSDLPAIRSYIDDGTTGLLVDAGDTHALTTALERLCDSPALRERLGKHAHEQAQSFSWQAQAQEFERVLEAVLTEQKRTHAPVSP